MGMLFQLANALALAAWVALIASVFVPAWRRAIWMASGFAVPLLLAVAYGALLAIFWSDAADGGFGSLAEVQALFQVPGLLVAGWLHYLAFDLFVGTWIARDAAERNLPRGAVVPSLVLTFLVGPLGLLLHAVVRALARRHESIVGVRP
ncbi:MAG TPA: ABA4-like family protein [Kiloniellales bacterium]|nr:ABA4-like family protein [Kiloniellales bacterium]